MELVIFTDGASRGNPGNGASGYYIKNNNVFYVESFNDVTNNRMEFNAILLALKGACEFYSSIKFDKINIYTDSQLVVGIFSDGWNCNKNIDLYDQINNIIEYFNSINIEVNFNKVKGHSGKLDDNYVIDKLLNIALDNNKSIFSGIYNASGVYAG